MNQTPDYMINGGARRSRRGSKSGFSLVEVLVAIAILTVGIVAFLQLFPIGFFDLLVASNTSNADRIAQSELNSLVTGNGAQIQQIAAIAQIYSDNTVQLDPQFSPDQPLSSRAKTPNTGFDYTPSYAPTTQYERYGYVSGELVHIANPETAGMPANALLDFGPIETPQNYTRATLWDTTKNTGFNSLDAGTHYDFFVHGLPWHGKSGDSTPVSGYADQFGQPVPHDDPEVELAQDSPEYLIDYTNGMIAFHQPTFTTTPKYNQTFVFQVRDSDMSPTAVEPKTFVFQTDWTGAVAQTAEPANTLACWNTTYTKPIWAPLVSTTAVPFTFTAVNQGTSTGTQTLVLPLVPGSDKLVRDFKQISTAFSDDPYEFQLGNNINSAADVTANSREVYIGQLLFNPRAATIVDNRGKPIQASVDYVVSDWHNIHEDKTVGSQISTGVGASGTSGSSVVRLTLNHLLHNGDRDQLGNKYAGVGYSGTDVYVYDLDTLAALPTADYTVDYDNGSVTVLNQPSGEHLRIYYHPAYDWGLSVLKPPATYTAIGSATAAPTPTLTGEVMFNGSTLYFPPADAGRLVQIGNIAVTDSATSATSNVAVNQLITVPAATGTLGTQSCVVALASKPYNFLMSTQTVDNVAVSGASITTRVIWRETNLWRHRDVTTVQLPTAD